MRMFWDREAQEGNLSYHIKFIYHILYHGIGLNDGHLRLYCTTMHYVRTRIAHRPPPSQKVRITLTDTNLLAGILNCSADFVDPVTAGISKNDACMTNETNALPLSTPLPYAHDTITTT